MKLAPLDTSRQQSLFWRTVHTLTLVSTSLQRQLSSVSKVTIVEGFNCKLWLRPSRNSTEVLVQGPHLRTTIYVRVMIGLLTSHCRFANQVATQASLQGLRTF